MFGYGGARLTANKIPNLDGLKSKANNKERRKDASIDKGKVSERIYIQQQGTRQLN